MFFIYSFVFVFPRHLLSFILLTLTTAALFPSSFFLSFFYTSHSRYCCSLSIIFLSHLFTLPTTSSQQTLSSSINSSLCHSLLLLLQDVDESTPFAPHVRGEIGAFGWHVISHLPANWEESKQLFVNTDGGRHRFFNVWPYMKALKSWISKQKKQKQREMVKLLPGESLRNFKFDRKSILQHLPPSSGGGVVA